ncbi:MAG TPA: Rieske 2Fe-2S domain-containing protein [Acidimicrobiales bacterium]|nr:Rieske 2Fe-2S domain-containing protein [Acidimicrobiales bacterium]
MTIDDDVGRPLPVSLGSRSSPYAALVTDDFRVHRSVFTDPRIFDDEMERIFGGTWVYLLHESEIAQRDDFATRRVGRRPVIIARGEDGSIAALLNRCTHRGTLLCPADQGSAARFQCAYHGWTFTNAGKLVGVTYPDGYRESFDVAAHNLERFPRVESYRGFVFGSLNAEIEPVADWLGPARPTFDWLVDRFPEMRMLKASTLEYHGNWKLQNDNNGDMYHVPFTHKSTVAMSEDRGYARAFGHFRNDRGPMVVRNFGHGHKMIDQRPGILSTWDGGRPVPGREAYADQLRQRIGEAEAHRYLELIGQSGVNLVIYPNLQFRGDGCLYVYEPVRVDLTRVHTYVGLLVNCPREVNALRMRHAEDFVNLGNRDDVEVFERTQEALADAREGAWVDVSKGWATDREFWEPGGALAGNVADETGIRSAYEQWRKLMTVDETAHLGATRVEHRAPAAVGP